MQDPLPFPTLPCSSSRHKGIRRRLEPPLFLHPANTLRPDQLMIVDQRDAQSHYVLIRNLVLDQMANKSLGVARVALGEETRTL